MAKILVTGSRGFLASRLLPLLEQGNHDVICFTSNKAKHVNRAINPKNVVTEDDLDSVLEKFQPEILLNLQVSFFFSHNTEALSEMVEANTFQPIRILDVCSKYGLKKVISATSFTEYGDSSDYHPINFFAATKAAFKTLARYYNVMRGITFYDVVVYDTFGEGDMRKKILNVFKDIQETGQVVDMSPGNQIIDLSHIDDVAAGFNRLVNRVASEVTVEFKTFYASTGNRYTLRELAAHVENIAGFKLKINWGGRPYREGEVMSPILPINDLNVCEVQPFDKRIKRFFS